MNLGNYTWAERAFIALIVIISLGTLTTVLVVTAQDAIYTKQQVDVINIAQAVQIYELHENTYPENVAGLNRWCRIGYNYRGKICLGELYNYTHIGPLPPSPTNEPYQYRFIEGGGHEVFIGFALGNSDIKPSAHERCYGNLGELMWCREVD